MEHRRPHQLPPGHASIWHNHPDTDMWGPIIHENNNTIQISVWGEPMRVLNKRDCIVTRADTT